MQEIKNMKYSKERALYHLVNAKVINCEFSGEEDGESPLKEARDIAVINTKIDLRYPLWHDLNLYLDNVNLTSNSRAALWYVKNLKIKNSNLHGIKAIRECENIEIENTSIISDEFAWRNNNICIKDSKLEGVYAFFETNNIEINNLTFTGKYSFQYVNNMTIKNSNFDTKDAFWHAKNVTVYDSILKGEYLAWYSENLTLINCKIIGTQPLCYCKNLKLINCEMEDTDLAFEYSEVDADIKGKILSVKNVIAGQVIADEIGDIIKEDSIYPLNAKILIRK